MSKLLSQRELDRIHARLSPTFRHRRLILNIAHAVVLILSLGIITFISYDTFNDIPFLENRVYMTFQFWVCVIFLADFFLEIFYTDNRRRYIRYNWFFLLISIPYLNLFEVLDLHFSTQVLYYIRFIPLIRGAYALAMVVGYFSSDKAISIITQYAVILLSIIYFSSLIFYYVEKDINSNVNSYWDSLYWAFMNVDTVGSDIVAMSSVGRILAIILALCGMMMLPLFTVYITAKVKDYNRRHEHSARTFLAGVHAMEQQQQPVQSTPSTEKPTQSMSPSAPNDR